MADRRTLQTERISGHPGACSGLRMQRDVKVCKLIDTTTCIGCKACEVACVEWNDMPFQSHHFRQHLPDHAGNALELTGT